MKAVIVVPFEKILALTSSLKMEIMNYRSKAKSGKPDEPMPGWRIPNSQLRSWMTGHGAAVASSIWIRRTWAPTVST